MKTAILVLMSLLLASAVYAANGANLRNVDIIGSRLNNIQICSDDVNLADTDIVGSTIANIEVSSPEKPHEKHTCEKTDCYWDPSCMDYPHAQPHVSSNVDSECCGKAECHGDSSCMNYPHDNADVSGNVNLENTEIVGSIITDVKIWPLEERQKKYPCEDTCKKTECYWGTSCMPHQGVDAWYGCYWFMDQRNTPKWPGGF